MTAQEDSQPRKHRRRGRGWLRALRKFLACLCLALMISSVYAPPAAAGLGYYVIDIGGIFQTVFGKVQDFVQDVGHSAFYEEISSQFQIAADYFGDQMDVYMDEETEATRLKQLSNKAMNEQSNRIGQARLDGIMKAKETGLNVEAAMASAQMESDQYVNNYMITREAAPYMMPFYYQVAYILRKGVDSIYRGPTDQGDGGQFTFDAQSGRCVGNGMKGIKKGNKIDGYKANCLAPVSLPGIGTADMDVSYSSLGPDQIYELPTHRFESVTVNGETTDVLRFVADDKNEAQRRWLAAAQYCYGLAGPRPTPPFGEGMDTGAGRDKRVMFNHCRARQTSFINQCARRLAMLTRPNCKETGMAAYCNMAKAACAAARESHLELPPNYDDCHNGLSLYEMSNVSNLICSSNRRLQTEGFSNAGDDEKLRIFSGCNQATSLWADMIQEDEEVFVTATEGARQVQDCFREIN